MNEIYDNISKRRSEDILQKALLTGQISHDTVEKAVKGEGSKGGKVIGHTKSGKPIYSSASHASHKKFNYQDHHDAMTAQRKLADKHEEDSDESEAHHEEADHHERKWDKLESKEKPGR